MPAPALVKPPVPASGALMAATILFAPLVAVVMVGVPDDVASVSTLPPLAFNSQRLVPLVLANCKFPIVRELSRVFVRLAVIAMVLKSAVASVPSAMMPLSQLLASLQTPLALLVQVPLAAWLTARLASKAAPADNRNDFFLMVFWVG